MASCHFANFSGHNRQLQRALLQVRIQKRLPAGEDRISYIMQLIFTLYQVVLIIGRLIGPRHSLDVDRILIIRSE